MAANSFGGDALGCQVEFFDCSFDCIGNLLVFDGEFLVVVEECVEWRGWVLGVLSDVVDVTR